MGPNVKMIGLFPESSEGRVPGDISPVRIDYNPHLAATFSSNELTGALLLVVSRIAFALIVFRCWLAAARTSDYREVRIGVGKLRLFPRRAAVGRNPRMLGKLSSSHQN
jgi:hypothetical protein